MVMASAASSVTDGPTLALLRAAFGPGSTLYTILQCAPSSSPGELKRAYRRAALRYHPDRRAAQPREEAVVGGGGAARTGGGGPSTLKFQAVSASYRILMDERRRSLYDATGRIVEEEEDRGDASGDDDGESDASRAPAARNRHHRSGGGQWEQFFQSVFNEIISTGAQHAEAAGAYRGSQEEKKDVLYYYKMCKGDMTKVVECMIHGTAEDAVRWKRKIVDPAVKRGEVDDYNAKNIKDEHTNRKKKYNRRILEEEPSSEEEISKLRSSSKSKRRRGKSKANSNSLLIDTDEEEEEPPDGRRSKPSTSGCAAADSSMSKRDKMDYRVAKKRKTKAAKEMELANIIGSKNWDADTAAAVGGSRRKKNMGGISDALLESMESRYGNHGKKRKKKR